MKQATIFAITSLVSLLSFAQPEGPIKIIDEKTNDGLTIYGTNEDIIPYTIEISVTQKNLESDVAFPAKIVIPPSTEPIPLTSLTKKDPTKGWSYGSQYTFYKGDYRSTHEDDYGYALPFESGKRFIMSQGYGGSFSHQGKMAIDFTMPEGTKVLAAREGLVVRVEEKSNKGCPSRECLELANLITIMHDDGSFAEYVHLKKNGSIVKVGDRVQRAEHIGYSGSTGFASGPHLHFEVYLPSKSANETVPTYFETQPGKKTKLVVKEFYEAF